jgi:DNA-binding CsgD family transcriptional regulator
VSECPALGIGICDAELRYVAVNNALAGLTGIPVEALIGKTVREVIGRSAVTVELMMRSVLFTGKSMLNAEIMVELPTRNSEAYWITNYFPIRDSTGRVSKVGALVIEITPLRRLEKSVLNLVGNRPLTRGQVTYLGVPYGLENESDELWGGSIQMVEKFVLETLRRSYKFPTYVLPTFPTEHSEQTHGSIPLDDGAKPLSPREKEIVQLLAIGKSNKEISTALNISVKTVETYRARILLKLQLHTIGDLVMYAVRHGLVRV